jgi:hypothetical protein
MKAPRQPLNPPPPPALPASRTTDCRPVAAVPAVRHQQPPAGIPDGAAHGSGLLPGAALRGRGYGRRRRPRRRRTRRTQALPSPEGQDRESRSLLCPIPPGERHCLSRDCLTRASDGFLA